MRERDWQRAEKVMLGVKKRQNICEMKKQSVKRKKTRSINLFSTTDPIHVAVSTTETLTDLQ